MSLGQQHISAHSLYIEVIQGHTIISVTGRQKLDVSIDDWPVKRNGDQGLSTFSEVTRICKGAAHKKVPAVRVVIQRAVHLKILGSSASIVGKLCEVQAAIFPTQESYKMAYICCIQGFLGPLIIFSFSS